MRQKRHKDLKKLTSWMNGAILMSLV